MAASSSMFVNPANIQSLVTVKLTKDNYLLWKTQVAPYLRGQRLFGFVDGSNPPPPITIPNPETATSSDTTAEIPNPKFTTCNAGIINDLNQSTLELDFSAFDRLFAVNVRGMAACVKHAALAMVEGGVRGSIVCTASVLATMATPIDPDYIMSKHAVLGLVRSASARLGDYEIRVNCVSPSGVATPLTCNLLKMTAEKVAKTMEPKTCLKGVVLTTSHVADAVVFLACDESEFITGHNLVVDGGFLPR
ncbi:hypothetical protein F0562_024938 [Nyssa sinensis]|uniref:Retrotransposon Copia-like N-terminal domain-containing protein n=1 Tax=Nyssa sinensis TaxID=561372 RepID=A0A5J5BE14_9ASTE|nr:hypothetical protein F0562_024938 [Nyssa sinensis]